MSNNGNDNFDESVLDDDLRIDNGIEQSSAPDPEGEEWTNTDPPRESAVGRSVDSASTKLGRFTERFLLNFTKPLPTGLPRKFWGGLHRASLKGMLKTSGADAICYSYQGNGKVKPMPIRNQGGHGDGDPLWISKDGKHKWIPSASGDEIALGPGHVPMAFASTDGEVLNSELTARVDQALALGDDWPLVKGASINAFFVEDDADNPKQAVADGGANRVLKDISIDNVPNTVPELQSRLEDHIIDLRRTDNRLLSWDGYLGAQVERMPSEEHENAEFRGRMAEKDHDYGDVVKKLFLYALAFILLAIAIMFLGPELVGGAGGAIGGGGGGVIPGGI